MKTPKVYYCALAAFCALTILSGIAHAADITSTGYGYHNFAGTGHAGFDLNNTTQQQQIIET